MTGENALKACRCCNREKGEFSEYGGGDRPDLTTWWTVTCVWCGFTAEAAKSPEAAAAKWNTRSPVCEDAREVVEALDEARALRDFVFDRTPGGQACGHEDLRLRRLAAGHVNRMDALAKSLPSLKGGSK